MSHKKPDYILFGTILALTLFGFFILFSISGSYSHEKFGSPYSLFLHQIIYGLIPGLILGFIAFKIPLAFLKKWALPLVLGNIILLALVFAPKIGVSLGGANRWLNLGLFTFQPSELLKLTSILYLAAWLSGKNATRSDFTTSKKDLKLIGQTFIPFLIILGVIAILLILQPDISTLGVIGLSALILYFIASTPVWQTFLIVLSGIAGFIALIKFEPYRFNRLLVFLKPETDPMGIGYHMKQALIAIGSGGILGVGLGLSHQKFGFLPQSIGDSIFAIFAEETGFLGALILISLFLIFAWRGLKIAKDSKNKFNQLLVTGITFWIVLQAFINIGSLVGILPLTGIPLPFISYGGTALVNELVAMGILLNISKQIKD